jgi:hypothetical protein
MVEEGEKPQGEIEVAPHHLKGLLIGAIAPGPPRKWGVVEGERELLRSISLQVAVRIVIVLVL